MKAQTEWTEEYWQNLKLSDDFLFGYVMQDVEMARIFLESLLDIEIESVSHIKTQDVIEIDPYLRGVRLDVKLKADGRLVNVEIQTTDKKDLPRRIRYYQALCDSQILLRRASLTELPEFITMFVCTFDPFREAGGKSEDGLPLYTVRHVVAEKPGLAYDDGRRVMIFNAAAWKKSLAKNQRDMLKYIQDGGKDFESAKVSGFASRVADAKADNAFRRHYMTLSLKIMEREWDARDEGYKEGVAAAQAQLAAEQARVAVLEARIAELEAKINKQE